SPLDLPRTCAENPTTSPRSSFPREMALTLSSCTRVAYTLFNLGNGSVARRLERTVP
ncbi:hypothetical protein A2U01_0071468, partial [Trifolium medium]|nr:hypothetical protein [Trifolium medium]